VAIGGEAGGWQDHKGDVIVRFKRNQPLNERETAVTNQGAERASVLDTYERGGSSDFLEEPAKRGKT